jgi:4-oxalocrotonate tautomerase
MMPVVKIDLLKGRSINQKRTMAEKITTVICEVAKVPKEEVHVVFTDYDKSDWASAGVLYSEK